MARKSGLCDTPWRDFPGHRAAVYVNIENGEKDADSAARVLVPPFLANFPFTRRRPEKHQSGSMDRFSRVRKKETAQTRPAEQHGAQPIL